MKFYRVLVIISVILAGVYVYVATAPGLRLTEDSWSYLNAAYMRQHHGGFPQNFASWPPLYPIMLSFFPDLFGAARWMNIVFYGVTIVLTLDLLRPRATPFALVGIMLALLLSPALTFIHQWAWSEVFFVVLTLLFFRRVSVTRSRQQVILLAIITMLACLQRYVGLVLIPIGVFALWQHRVRFRQIVLYVVIAVLPVSIWVLRNLVLGQGPAGIRNPPIRDFFGNAHLWWGIFTTWFACLALVAIVTWLRPIRLPRMLVISSGLYVVFFILFMIGGSSVTYVDLADNRLLAPAYIPVVFLVIAGVYALRTRLLPARAPAADVSVLRPTGSP